MSSVKQRHNKTKNFRASETSLNDTYPLAGKKNAMNKVPTYKFKHFENTNMIKRTRKRNSVIATTENYTEKNTLAKKT